MVLDDLLRPGLKVVFCGTAVGAASARRGAYYAGPGNRFWPTLHAVGFTPRLVVPEDYRSIERLGLGLTDISKTAVGNDDEIAPSSYDPARLATVIAAASPKAVAFTSKRAASVALGVPTGRLAYGRQPEPFAGAEAWVLPSPSGAARRYWREEPWRELAQRMGFAAG